MAPISTLSAKYYFRIEVVDQPGVLGKIATIFGECGISISSFIQKELDKKTSDAELVIMTHESTESSVDRAVTGLRELEVVNMIGNVIRVVE